MKTRFRRRSIALWYLSFAAVAMAIIWVQYPPSTRSSLNTETTIQAARTPANALGKSVTGKIHALQERLDNAGNWQDEFSARF